MPLSATSMPPPRWGKLLGYCGLVPFVGLALASWMAEDSRQPQVVFALLAYGATILSFLGAIHWGLALLAAGLWACWIVDRSIYPRFGLRGWLSMRLVLTAAASLSCFSAAVRCLQ